MQNDTSAAVAWLKGALFRTLIFMLVALVVTLSSGDSEWFDLFFNTLLAGPLWFFLVEMAYLLLIMKQRRLPTHGYGHHDQYP